MSRPAPLRLGTRGSLLAVAQARQVADALMARVPGLTVRIETVHTRGDADLQTPLATVRDPGFFSAAIDEALLRGDVDFAVHSRKDLDGPRPAELVTAAMPARANPREALLFRGDVTRRLLAGEALRVGTSSARREAQVRRFLKQALPRLGPPPRLEFVALRGAVDARLARLSAAAGHEGALDAVVVALAALERLWADADGRRSLQPLLEELRWMVAPLSACPAAPGQGALVLECRRDDHATREQLRLLHDADTEAAVAAEYAAAADHDEAFAATAVAVPELGRLLYTRGGADAADGRLHWPAPAPPSRARAWDGGDWTRACTRRRLDVDLSALRQQAVYVAHWHALSGELAGLAHKRIWVSGVESWARLAAQGLWVEGCADGLGFDAVQSTLATPVLQLPALADWAVLTRAGAEGSWQQTGVGQVLPTYALEGPVASALAQIRSGVRDATHFFWGSREQYLALRDELPQRAEHACGSGKTLRALRDMGEQPAVFPSREAWRQWLA